MTGLGGSGARVLDSGVVFVFFFTVTDRDRHLGRYLGRLADRSCVCAGTALSLLLLHTDDSSSYS